MGCGGVIPSTAVQLVLDSVYSTSELPPPIEIIPENWVTPPVPQYEPVVLEEFKIDGVPPGVAPVDIIKPGHVYVPPDFTIAPPTIGKPPGLDALAPTIVEPGEPDPFDGEKPTGPPDVSPIVIPPPLEDIELPPVPQLSDVMLPDRIELNIPEWTQELPSPDFQIPDMYFSYTEAPYSSELLDGVTAEIQRMLDGGTGLPEAVWQLIFAKGADQEEITGAKLIEEATTDWAERGWGSPGGVLDKRIRAARQLVQNARNTLARDTSIKRAEMELENLKYAIAQSLALETILIALHNSTQDRALKVAELNVSMAVQIIQANIALYTVELEQYKTAASVFKTLIDSELVRVEAYKAEIEAESLRVEVDKNRIEAYKVQVQALMVAIEVHNSQIKALALQVELDKARIEAYIAQVQAYDSEIKAWNSEWDGYRSAWQGQDAKAQVYKTQVEAFATDTGAFKTQADVEIARVQSDINTVQLHTDRMRADATRFTAEVQFQAAKANTIAENYRTLMSGFQAQASFTSAKASVYEAKLKADISNAQAVASSAMESARLAAAQINALQTANLSAQETTARIWAQIESSHMSQFSAHASHNASSNDSFAYDCS